MSPLDFALRPLKKVFVFKGRAPRAEYWWFYFAAIVAGVIASTLDQIARTEFIEPAARLILLPPSFSVLVRRLHDVDRSGWWIAGIGAPLIVLATVAALLAFESAPAAPVGVMAVAIAAGALLGIGGILLFIFTIRRGTVGPNRFGDDPYPAGNLEQVFA